MNDEKALKPFPKFKSEAEAEDFVEKADLTEYDLSGFRPVRITFAETPAPYDDPNSPKRRR